ncbi:MAG: riboflavin biosynthesis protein RibF [Vallitaleaceae bacterium]|nr:riboflavin biosynthesis protein RibF [Vallitaleaceae bacterium]
MKTILQTNVFELPQCIVVFGNFDGVHKGHQLLIEEALNKSKELGIPSALFTFKPHPTYVVMGKPEEDIIFTPEEKKKVVKDLGVDYYIEYPFTMDVANMAAEVFVEEVIYKELHAKYVVVGVDFKFGKGRSGSIPLLEALGVTYGFNVIAFEKLCDHKRVISSTWLRQEIKKGDMEAFKELTGRHFIVLGEVEHGRSIGRTIGFPTANVATAPSKILPPNGVYASYTTVKGIRYKSITNVGPKPASTLDEMVVETYILDFDEMIYGETILIEMTHFLREAYELKSLDHLKSLIQDDLKDLDNYFEKTSKV